jgi:hypothetical protein
MEAHHKKTSAQIELENEDGEGSGENLLPRRNRSWKVELNKCDFSCSESIAN